MPQPIVDISDLSDAYAILESQGPALPYELDPRFSDPIICKRIGDVIARAMILPSRPAWNLADTSKPSHYGAR
jgi:hypothetical protein